MGSSAFLHGLCRVAHCMFVLLLAMQLTCLLLDGAVLPEPSALSAPLPLCRSDRFGEEGAAVWVGLA